MDECDLISLSKNEGYEIFHFAKLCGTQNDTTKQV